VDRRFSGETLARLDKRLAALSAAVENQEGAAAAELLAGLSGKIDVLSEAMDSQGPRGTRRDLEALDRKLDQVTRSLADQAEHLSRPQLEPLQERLDALQARLEDLAEGVRASSAELGPFAQTLQDISTASPLLETRATSASSTSGSPPSRSVWQAWGPAAPIPALCTISWKNIVSRLELLKGRSIDPARLGEIFDKVDAAMRSGIGRRALRTASSACWTSCPSGDAGRPLISRLADRLDAHAGAAGFRRPPGEAGRAARRPWPVYAAEARGSAEESGDLRGDIVALRRELRSLPVWVKARRISVLSSRRSPPV
jgi:hypothetical protein